MNNLLSRFFLLLVAAFCVAASVLAASDDAVFMPVTAESQLRDSDQIVVVSRDYCQGMSRFPDGKGIKACRVLLQGDGSLVGVDADSLCVLTVRRQQNGWRMQREDGQCLWTSDGSQEELVFYPSTSYYRNHVNTATLDFDETGNCDILFRKGNYKHYIKYTPTGERFGSYPTALSVKRVQIFRRLRNSSIVDELTLRDSGGNRQLLADGMDMRVRTAIIDRTFAADGGYYTLCLPISLSSADLENAFGGASFYGFTSVENAGDNVVRFRFSRVSHTEAGVPYLMCPLSGTSSVDIIAPRVSDKMILATEPATISHSLDGWRYSFVGTFDPVLLPAEGSIRFLGGNGLRLVTPNCDGNLPGLRAYFQLPDASPSTAFDADNEGVSYVVAIDDALSGDATGIIRPQDNAARRATTTIYNMCGQRMATPLEHLPKGIYVVDGRKTIRK